MNKLFMPPSSVHAIFVLSVCFGFWPLFVQQGLAMPFESSDGEGSWCTSQQRVTYARRATLKVAGTAMEETMRTCKAMFTNPQYSMEAPPTKASFRQESEQTRTKSRKMSEDFVEKYQDKYRLNAFSEKARLHYFRRKHWYSKDVRLQLYFFLCSPLPGTHTRDPVRAPC